MTFMMRPSVSSPTGTAIGWPVSRTSWPRTRPSVDVHGDGAHGVLAEMLRDLEHQAVAVVVGLERVQDRRQVAVELHVDDGAHHLRDPAGLTALLRLPFSSSLSLRAVRLARSESAPACTLIAQASTRSSLRSMRPSRSSKRSIACSKRPADRQPIDPLVHRSQQDLHLPHLICTVSDGLLDADIRCFRSEMSSRMLLAHPAEMLQDQIGVSSVMSVTCGISSTRQAHASTPPRRRR